MTKIKRFLKNNIKQITLIFLLIIISVYFYMSMTWYTISIVDSEIEHKVRLVSQYEMSHLWMFIFLNILLILRFYNKKINLNYLFVFWLIYAGLYFVIIDNLRIYH